MTTSKMPKTKSDKSDKKTETLIEKRIRENQQIWVEEYLKYWTVAAACKSTGINRDTYYEWLKKYPDFVKQIEEEKKQQIEYVESKLYEAIQKGNLTAIIFFLKNRARQKWGAEERRKVEEETTYKLKLTDDQRTEIKKLIKEGKI
ncbi:MAG: hypothetical protein HYW70_00280 [Candidatus Nealsonbacteria bacterium]|nr:hypothetical protein [Candidatus Nealsonbacteria bacterium]